MFTYREERRLFAVISVIIVAALVALVQMASARAGATSPLSSAFGAFAALFENTIGNATVSTRGALIAGSQAPHLLRENARLHAQNVQLEQENARLQQQLATSRGVLRTQPVVDQYARAVPARVVGFPPENEVQSVTINAGSRAGIGRDDGVVNGDGVVGRVVESTPFMSKLLLITDYTSSIPALVQRGRWWGVAKGNLTSVRLEYVSQDARIRVGDKVVTGEARSFHAGEVIGTITRIDRSPTGLYQTAIVKPAADLGSLDRVVVLPK